MRAKAISPKRHIVFAWELGGNFGHVSKVAEIARAIGAAADLTILAKDVAAFGALAPDLADRVLQAPFPTALTRGANRESLNLPDELGQIGWEDPTTLAALVGGWDRLLDRLKPDVLVAQAAPTALLAAQGRNLPRAIFGSGYDAPPRSAPMPAYAPWQDDPSNRIAAREAEVLAAVNQTLARLGKPRLKAFADLFRTEAYCLATFREVDCYPERARLEPDGPKYMGALATTDAGREIAWRSGGGRRLFAYLRPRHPGGKAAIEAFAGLSEDWDVIVAAPGLQPAEIARRTRPGLRLLDGPVKVGPLLADCDIGVSHGSHGMAAQFVGAGVPQICLPNHLEQVMTARALANNRLALSLIGEFTAPQIHAGVLRVAGLPKLRENNQAAAANLAANDMFRAAERIADDLLRLAR